MPYQLDHQGQGTNAHASVPTWSTSASTVWSVEFVVDISSLTNTIALGGATYAARLIQIVSNGTVSCQNSGGGTVLSSAAGAAVVGVNTIKVERTSGGLWQLTVNGVAVSTSSTAAAAPMTYLARRVATTYFSSTVAVRSVTTVGGTYSTSWNSSNAPSTGTTWTSSGGQAATLTSFTGTTDSWWVFYSSGASNYADTLLAGSYAHGGSLLNSSVGYSSALQAGSYSHSGSVLGSAVGYSSALQSGAFSYSGSELQSIIQNGAQNYSDTLLGGSFAHTGSALQSAIARNSTLLAGSHSHAGSSLTASLAFYSTLNGGAYSHFGSMLQSTVSGQVTVSIEGYTITFAADDVSGAFAADTVAATFINDYVSATWSN